MAVPCLVQALEAERRWGMPRGLLLAIALVESGDAGVPDSSVVTVGGSARRGLDPAEAVRRVTDRRGRPLPNVYVGCMQLSAYFHGRHFPSLEAMFDRELNVSYAAEYLAGHRQNTRSWAGALQRYNGGGNPSYVCKVVAAMRAMRLSSASEVAPRSGCAQPAVAPEIIRALALDEDHQNRRLQTVQAIPGRPAGG